MGRPNVHIQEQKPRPGDERAIAQAIWELSTYPIERAYRGVKTVTAAYTMDPVRDRVILADGSAGAFQVTIPSAAEADHVEYTVVAIDVTGNITVAATSGNINGAANVVLGTQYLTITVVSDGSNYFRTDL